MMANPIGGIIDRATSARNVRNRGIFFRLFLSARNATPVRRHDLLKRSQPSKPSNALETTFLSRYLLHALRTFTVEPLAIELASLGLCPDRSRNLCASRQFNASNSRLPLTNHPIESIPANPSRISVGQTLTPSNQRKGSCINVVGIRQGVIADRTPQRIPSIMTVVRTLIENGTLMRSDAPISTSIIPTIPPPRINISNRRRQKEMTRHIAPTATIVAIVYRLSELRCLCQIFRIGHAIIAAKTVNAKRNLLVRRDPSNTVRHLYSSSCH